MISVETIVSGPYQTNSYLVCKEGSDTAVLIDAPPQISESLAARLQKSGKKLAAVFITHGHFDHVLGLADLAFPGLAADSGTVFSDIPEIRNMFAEDFRNEPKIFAHPDAVEKIRNPQTFGLNIQVPGQLRNLEVSGILSDNMKISVSGISIKTLFVPGHSSCSAAFYLAEGPVCFTGDLVFRESVGRCDLPGGDFNVLERSILQRIFTMDDSVILYPGHGEPTTVKHEKNNNPYVGQKS